MMVHCVASPPVSDLLPAAGLAGATHANDRREERRDPHPAPRSGDPATAASKAALVLARPCRPRRVDQAVAQAIADLAAGDPRGRAQLAPPTGPPGMDPPP